MELGFLTSCFDVSLLDKVHLANQLNYSQLEVSLTPSSIQRLSFFDTQLLNSELFENEVRI